MSRRYAGGSLPTLPRDLGNRFLDIVKLDDYQEPYQALKYAPYYSYSTVVMEMKDMMLNNKGSNINHSGMYTGGTRSPRVVLHIRARLPTCARVHVCTCINIRVQAHVLEIEGIRIRMCTEQQSIRLTAINTLSPCTLFSPPPPPPSSFAISSAAVYANGAVDTSYDYAVPELGTVPLLNQDGTGRGPPASAAASGDQDNTIFSKTSSRGNKTENKKVRGICIEISNDVCSDNCWNDNGSVLNECMMKF